MSNVNVHYFYNKPFIINIFIFKFTDVYMDTGDLVP